jgi:L-threonylcarbamoyladenylate synthase
MSEQNERRAESGAGAEAGERAHTERAHTERLHTERLRAWGIRGPAEIARAATLLREGNTVAFPTETVYGLGANALSPAAVEKVFAAKQRPGWDPLIVHVEGREMLERVADISGDMQARAEALMAAFWPGALTLLLPRTAEVPDAITAGRPLVGVRTPAHPVARELIRQAKVPVAAPSANLFGRPSPTTADHVLADLDGRIDVVLDGGPTTIGVESTVLDVGAMTIYRPGAVTAAMISRVAGAEAKVVSGAESAGQAAAPASLPAALPSPGMGIRHYAPQGRLVLVRDQREMAEALAKHATDDVGVFLPDDWQPGAVRIVFRWGPWGEPETLARLLFTGLRLMDERGVKVIVCPVPDGAGLAEAVRDRLEKAAREG